MCYRVGDAEGALSFAYATETGRQTGAGRALCTSPFPHSLSPFVVWQHQGSLTWRIALPSSLRWWRYQKVRMEWDELMCACRYIGVCVWVGGLEGCPLISVPEAANISHPFPCPPNLPQFVTRVRQKTQCFKLCMGRFLSAWARRSHTCTCSYAHTCLCPNASTKLLPKKRSGCHNRDITTWVSGFE